MCLKKIYIASIADGLRQGLFGFGGLISRTDICGGDVGKSIHDAWSHAMEERATQNGSQGQHLSLVDRVSPHFLAFFADLPYPSSVGVRWSDPLP